MREARKDLRDYIISKSTRDIMTEGIETIIKQRYKGISHNEVDRMITFAERVLERNTGRNRSNIVDSTKPQRKGRIIPASTFLSKYSRSYEREYQRKLKRLMSEYEYEQEKEIENAKYIGR